MLEGVEVLYHSSIKISKNRVIYIDPYKISRDYNDADVIFITHDHYDHFSETDIDRVRKKETFIVVPEDLYDKVYARGFKKEKIITVEPEDRDQVLDIKFEVVPAYNINKPFHPKKNKWVGYILIIDKNRYYIAGDTDITEENMQVKCDVAFVPVGGTYTMDYKEAASLINKIKPKFAIPIHYGSVVGTKEDAINFVELLDSSIEGKILMK